MKKILIFSIAMAVCTWAFNSCTHKSEAPAPANGGNGGNNGGNGGNNGGNGGTGSVDTSLCFERDILPIFVSNCAKSGCHDAASHKEGFVFTSYETITSKEFKKGDADDTELYEKITEDDEDKRMPQPPNPPLTAEQIALIRDWINRGAPNTKNCPSKGDTANVTYSGVIKPMLDAYCKGCHNATVQNGGKSFETHASTVAAVNSGRFLGAIKHDPGFSPMPQGGNKLSDIQVKQIEKWIAGGMPNN